MSGRARLPAWIGLAVATIGLLAVAAVDTGGVETDAEKVQRLSQSYACPVCSGESVAESNAAVAATIRQFISDEVTAGTPEGQIRDELIQAYGAEVLLNPPAEGIATLVWVLPVVVAVLGSVVLAAALTRRRGGGREATAEDRELVARARQRVRATGDEPS